MLGESPEQRLTDYSPDRRLRLRRFPFPTYCSSCVRQSVSWTNCRESRHSALHLDEQLKKDLRVQQPLDLQTRRRADLLQRASLLADQDGLLPIALAVDGGSDAGQLRALLVLFDQHGGRVRDFLLGDQQHLLANQFGHQEALRLVGDLIFREVARTFRQSLDDGVQQSVESFALQRGDRNDLGEIVQLFVLARSAAAASACSGRRLCSAAGKSSGRSSSRCRARTDRRCPNLAVASTMSSSRSQPSSAS